MCMGEWGDGDSVQEEVHISKCVHFSLISTEPVLWSAVSQTEQEQEQSQSSCVK